MRYLVVPERIAVQVDHAFTSPQVTAPPVRPTKDNVPRQKSNVRPLPKTTAASTGSSQQNNNQNRQPSKTVGTQPQQLQATAGNSTTISESNCKGGGPGSGTRSQQRGTSKEPITAIIFPKNICRVLPLSGRSGEKFRDGSEHFFRRRFE